MADHVQRCTSGNHRNCLGLEALFQSQPQEANSSCSNFIGISFQGPCKWHVQLQDYHTQGIPVLGSYQLLIALLVYIPPTTPGAVLL